MLLRLHIGTASAPVPFLIQHDSILRVVVTPQSFEKLWAEEMKAPYSGYSPISHEGFVYYEARNRYMRAPEGVARIEYGDARNIEEVTRADWEAVWRAAGELQRADVYAAWLNGQAPFRSKLVLANTEIPIHESLDDIERLESEWLQKHK